MSILYIYEISKNMNGYRKNLECEPDLIPKTICNETTGLVDSLLNN